MWISVKDRLPTEIGEYLVYAQMYAYGNSKRVTCLSWCSDYANDFVGNHWDYYGNVNQDFEKITHWMPLPLPPNSENVEAETHQ